MVRIRCCYIRGRCKQRPNSWCYEILLGLAYGAVVGWVAKEALRFAEQRRYVDRESFLVFAIALALFIIGADAVARDANGRSVDSRTIHQGVQCLNLRHEAQSVDVLQVTGGRLNIWSQLNCRGSRKKTSKKGNGQFPGFRFRSWEMGL